MQVLKAMYLLGVRPAQISLSLGVTRASLAQWDRGMVPNAQHRAMLLLNARRCVERCKDATASQYMQESAKAKMSEKIQQAIALIDKQEAEWTDDLSPMHFAMAVEKLSKDPIEYPNQH